MKIAKLLIIDGLNLVAFFKLQNILLKTELRGKITRREKIKKISSER